ncbi:MurC [Acrasis kona]|uniref:MurC n=1 Tax=Acrasis kona TaxID=1008807 RepID=A0AAW2ZE19_9EUKA
MQGLTFTHDRYKVVLYDDNTYELVEENGSLHNLTHEEKHEGAWEVIADNKEGTTISMNPNNLPNEKHQEKKEGLIKGGLSVPESLIGVIDGELFFTGSSTKTTDQGLIDVSQVIDSKKDVEKHETDLSNKFEDIGKTCNNTSS